MKRLSTGIAAIGLLAEEISFSLTGKQISDVSGYIPVTCVPPTGRRPPARPASTRRAPSPSARRRRRATPKNMAYKGDVTKNYELCFEKLNGVRWLVDLHLDYSYEDVFFGYCSELEQKFVICQRADDFRIPD